MLFAIFLWQQGPYDSFTGILVEASSREEALRKFANVRSLEVVRLKTDDHPMRSQLRTKENGRICDYSARETEVIA